MLAWVTMAIIVPAPPSRIIIAGGPKGGSYEQYAMKYREILARSHVKVDVRTTGGAGENLKRLEDSTSIRTLPSLRASSTSLGLSALIRAPLGGAASIRYSSAGT